MKLLLCTIVVVYLLQAYRLASLVHREAEVDVPLSIMFLRSLNPLEPEPGFFGMLQNVWWLLIGKQLKVVKDIIVSQEDGDGFPNFIEMLHMVEQDIMQGIIIPIAIRDAGTFSEVHSNLVSIVKDIITKTPKTARGHEALSRIRRVAKKERVVVNDIITEIPNLLGYVRNTTITKLSKDTIRK